jgi:hypothetical protein
MAPSLELARLDTIRAPCIESGPATRLDSRHRLEKIPTDGGVGGDARPPVYGYPPVVLHIFSLTRG